MYLNITWRCRVCNRLFDTSYSKYGGDQEHGPICGCNNVPMEPLHIEEIRDQYDAPKGCPATTREGNPCPLKSEEARGGWCHVHDPNGTFQRQQREKHQ